ncbi:MAG: 23S rRNA (pseudouridine(1915)-N(3))-methyltransferase RlmH [Clostridiales Family XIII bacterium]|nr:23S rRNA (pseudouridine(1915)-N(3))-methyltransferase RlmH [Clostridiales Family XIII bacterium]
MNIDIVCVGALRERYWKEAYGEYIKRLGKYCTPTTVEIKETRVPDNPSPAEEVQVKDSEGKAIMKKIRQGSYVIALDVNGDQLSSEGLAGKLQALLLEGASNITFIIGGSLGLSEEIIKTADCRLSFSKMTFPHQMMRVILSEQVYRSFKIIRNESYHK